VFRGFFHDLELSPVMVDFGLIKSVAFGVDHFRIGHYVPSRCHILGGFHYERSISKAVCFASYGAQLPSGVRYAVPYSFLKIPRSNYRDEF
jgi:hypothetical protein